MKRIYVIVDSEQDANGNIKPQKIHWKDGRVWTIKRVLLMFKIQDGDSSVWQYNVLIHGQQKQLFRDNNLWYVKPKG